MFMNSDIFICMFLIFCRLINVVEITVKLLLQTGSFQHLLRKPNYTFYDSRRPCNFNFKQQENGVKSIFTSRFLVFRIFNRVLVS